MKKQTVLTRTRTTLVAALAAASVMASCEMANGPARADSGGGTSRGGSMARFAIAGDWLYTVNDHLMSVVSIADPERPVEGDRIAIGSNIETIFPMDTLLLIGSQNGMYIYNIKNPEFPRHLSTSLHFRSCDPVVAADTLAFVTLNSSLGAWCGSGGNALQVYNIRDLSAPKLLGEVPMSSPRGLAVDPDSKLLFVCDNGIKAFDIADPLDPEPLYSSLSTPEVGKIDAYDCMITDQGRLLVIGADGLYQLGYDRAGFSFTSKIDIRREQ
ncbi:MAG: hypothetical protein LBU98_03675 [Alistipes sp.]|jgi:hypothetical protein|nr:hypothetical protein [Alistipes sp.]